MGGRGTHGLVDAGAGTDDVDGAEFPVCDTEHALQMLPVADVGPLEDGFGGGGAGVVGDEVLGFGPEGEVGEEDVAVFGEEGAGEGEVDPWAGC